MCRKNLIIKENSSLSSHGLKPRGFSRSLLYKKIIEISGVYSEKEEAKRIIAEIIKKYLENNN